MFIFQVKAISKNSGQSSSASLTVHVVNVNDNVPRFSQESYSVSIAEGSGSSRPVITVNVCKPERNNVVCNKHDEPNR